MKYITTIDEKEFAVEIIDDHHARINDKVFEVDFESVSGQPVYSLLIDGKSYEAYVYAVEDEWQVLLFGKQYPAKVEDEREKRLKTSVGGKVQESGEFQLKAPMPGLVVAIPVNEGQQIEKGQVLVILEIDENAKRAEVTTRRQSGTCESESRRECGTTAVAIKRNITYCVDDLVIELLEGLAGYEAFQFLFQGSHADGE